MDTEVVDPDSLWYLCGQFSLVKQEDSYVSESDVEVFPSVAAAKPVSCWNELTDRAFRAAADSSVVVLTLCFFKSLTKNAEDEVTIIKEDVLGEFQLDFVLLFKDVFE